MTDEELTWERYNAICRILRDRIPDIYNYSSKATSCRAGLSSGLITQNEYDFVKAQSGAFWDYTGD
jgi:hypothetical protein